MFESKKNKKKVLVIFQAVRIIVIAILIGILIYELGVPQKSAGQEKQPIGFLSPVVYADMGQPKQFNIVNFEPLRIDIQNYLSSGRINASVFVMNLKNSAYISINRQAYYSASLNKLPVAILIMQKIENKKLTFDTKLTILNSDRTESSGSLYATSLHELPVKVLLEDMLKESDNTALNVLFRQVEAEDLPKLLNYFNVDLNSNYHFEQTENTTYKFITPQTMSNIFSSLYFSTLLEPKDSEYLLSLLANTTFDINKLAELPKNIIAAQKFGEYDSPDTKLFHDCGILYMNQSRIFYCVMINGFDGTGGRQIAGILVHKIYKFVVETRAKLDQYKKEVEEVK